MSSLTPGMQSALAQDRVIVVLLVKAELPGRDLCLLIGGAGSVGWNGNVYSDVDDVFGTVAAIDDIEDGAGDEAPDWSMSMLPPSDSSAAQLTAPTYQEAPTYLWLAVVDPSSGLVIADPFMIASYLWDVGTLVPDRSKREVDIQFASMFERLLEDDDGAYLSDAFHQSIYPGETGFANLTGIEQTVDWGVVTPSTAVTTTSYGPYPGDIA